jgi:hypothetical protein
MKKSPNPDNLFYWTITVCLCLSIATCTAKEVYMDIQEMTNGQR